jgi:hypothetical protein
MQHPSLQQDWPQEAVSFKAEASFTASFKARASFKALGFEASKILWASKLRGFF